MGGFTIGSLPGEDGWQTADDGWHGRTWVSDYGNIVGRQDRETAAPWGSELTLSAIFGQKWPTTGRFPDDRDNPNHRTPGSRVLYAHLGGVPAINAYSYIYRNG